MVFVCIRVCLLILYYALLSQIQNDQIRTEGRAAF